MGNVALTNLGSGPWKNWTVEFDAGFEITNLWNGEIVSRVGTRYVVKAASWNGVVAPGASVSFGFQASKPTGLTPVLDNVLLKPVL